MSEQYSTIVSGSSDMSAIWKGSHRMTNREVFDALNATATLQARVVELEAATELHLPPASEFSPDPAERGQQAFNALKAVLPGGYPGDIRLGISFDEGKDHWLQAIEIEYGEYIFHAHFPQANAEVLRRAATIIETLQEWIASLNLLEPPHV